MGDLKQLNSPNTIGEENKCQVVAEIEDTEFCSEFSVFTCHNINLNCESEKYKEITNFLQNIGKLNDNPLVNISNFVMFDMGRPSHMYDLDKISGNSIVIRESKKGEKFLALGGVEYTMPDGIGVICDEEKILCVGGIMGGELSKVDANTKNILVEVADFNPEKVSLGGQILNINSDSRFRFESRVDSGTTGKCLADIKEFLRDMCNSVTDVNIAKGYETHYLKNINFSLTQLKKYLGIAITEREVETILEKLHFQPEKSSNDPACWNLTIPSWKWGDIEIYQDVIEEVLRMGLVERINLANKSLDKQDYIIQGSIDSAINGNNATASDHRGIRNSLISELKDVMFGRGLDEVITWSFYSQADEETSMLHENHFKKFCSIGSKKNEKRSDDIETIHITNPINNNFTIMRRSMIPNLVRILDNNFKRGYSNLSFFEVGNIYGHNIENKQMLCIAGMRSGQVSNHSIHEKNRIWDFYDARDDVMGLLESLGMSSSIFDYKVDYETPGYYHPNRSIGIKLGMSTIAFCGELHPSIMRNKKFDTSVVMFEILIHNLPSKVYKPRKHKTFTISNYQSIERDFAFILDENIKAGDIVKTIQGLNNRKISKIDIFDVYQGKGMDPNKKSVAIKVKIQPENANMNEEAIQDISDNIVNALQKEYSAILRDK